MPKRYSSKETIKKLSKLGFEVISRKGRHVKMKHRDGAITIIPDGKKILPPGTISGILDKAGVSKPDFEQA